VTITIFSACFFLSFSLFGHFLHWYSFSPHLKYHIIFAFSCLLTTSSLAPHCITLLVSIANLFWGTSFLFSFPFLFLQFQARCYNLVKQLSHYLYFFSFLLFYFFSFTLNLLYKKECGKVLHSCSHITGSHSVMSHDVT